MYTYFLHLLFSLSLSLSYYSLSFHSKLVALNSDATDQQQQVTLEDANLFHSANYLWMNVLKLSRQPTEDEAYYFYTIGGRYQKSIVATPIPKVTTNPFVQLDNALEVTVGFGFFGFFGTIQIV